MKKLIALVVAIICMGLVGCGSKGENLKIKEIELTSETYAFAIKKDNDKLKNFVNDYIDEISANGTLEDITKTFFDGIPDFKYSNPKSKDGCLIIATSADFPPFEYFDGNEFTGIDIQIAYNIAEKAGKKLYVDNMSIESVVQSVKIGKCHIAMAGLTVTEDRLTHVDFSKGYYKSSQMLVVRKSNTEFDNCKNKTDIENILKSKDKNFKIGAQKGTTGYFYSVGGKDSGFEGFPNLTTDACTTGAIAMQNLAIGKIDAVVIDQKTGSEIVAARNANLSAFDLFKKQFITNKGYIAMFEGLKNTLLISFIGLLIGFLMGSLITVIKLIPSNKNIVKILKGACSVYVNFLRGTPLIVQLLLCHFALFPALGINIDNVSEAIIIYGINSSAYLSETLRSGIRSVDKGQMEAGRALGFSFTTTMIKIVLPQAVKNIVPSLGNEFISLIKETSVATLIAVTDLTRSLQAIAESTYEYFIPYIVLALIYLVLVLFITLIIKFTERGFAKNEQ